jgi:hypothetical protein
MYIDFRILLPVFLPFVFLALARAVWWFAGAPWSDPTVAAFASLSLGVIIGGGAGAILYTEGIKIGGIRLRPLSWY